MEFTVYGRVVIAASKAIVVDAENEEEAELKAIELIRDYGEIFAVEIDIHASEGE
jgi:hypothetical protein